ncbi:LpxL/LpxP family acyltransferase [Azohydromonas australica]|uniref:LpxL/LpxP family acyltransferase n=1 Tax=Azohydromonas australica TaxID=364039 RepID=UPI0004151D4D|nr:lipid A biosynthesis acyltransferase [Azohydromonas australica]
MSFGAKLGIGLLRAIYRLPLGAQAAIGQGLGKLLHALAGSRRRIALRNLALCFPHMDTAERERLVREHFGWLGRSLLERGLLWYAPVERLKTLIHVEGDVTLAERSERPVMWLVPHFVGLDVAGVATQLFQKQKVGSIYQAQSNPVWDAEIRKGRLRFNQGEVFARSERALPLVRAIRRGWAFFNLPDMDFGIQDAAFVPFFDVPAATLLAPSKMARSLNMVVQPVVAEMLPGGQGYKVKFLPAWDDWPTEDAQADAARMNRWIEEQIRHCPAQYLWVHKRFKTRPAGEPSLYG